MELALNGIGGYSVASCKDNLSAEEVSLWLEYRRKYGSLDIRRTIEFAAATIAYSQALTVPRKPGSPKPKFDNYLPQREKEISLEEAMATWK